MEILHRGKGIALAKPQPNLPFGDASLPPPWSARAAGRLALAGRGVTLATARTQQGHHGMKRSPMLRGMIGVFALGALLALLDLFLKRT